jgi:lipid A 3-O-deacylase
LGLFMSSKWVLGMGGVISFLVVHAAAMAAENSPPESTGAGRVQAAVSPWNNEVGDGFRRGVWEAGFSLGGGPGMRILGSRDHHDLALARVFAGWMATDLLADDKWYRGNCEVMGEFFGGVQFYPHKAYVFGLAPVLRYNFATGSRWVPFVDAGAGVTATDIRGRDLSTTFEFNLQGGAGVNYFWRRDRAVTLQYRFLHISNAALDLPNLGVNVSLFSLGVSCFF